MPIIAALCSVQPAIKRAAQTFVDETRKTARNAYNDVISTLYNFLVQKRSVQQ